MLLEQCLTLGCFGKTKEAFHLCCNIHQNEQVEKLLNVLPLSRELAITKSETHAKSGYILSDNLCDHKIADCWHQMILKNILTKFLPETTCQVTDRLLIILNQHWSASLKKTRRACIQVICHSSTI